MLVPASANKHKNPQNMFALGIIWSTCPHNIVNTHILKNKKAPIGFRRPPVQTHAYTNTHTHFYKSLFLTSFFHYPHESQELGPVLPNQTQTEFQKAQLNTPIPPPTLWLLPPSFLPPLLSPIFCLFLLLLLLLFF